MIVVAIIGILAAIAIPNFVKFQARSKQAEAKSNLRSWFVSERSYLQEKGFYSEYTTVVGFSPERGNRYAYYFSQSRNCERRETTGVSRPTGGNANCISVDTGKHSGAEALPEYLKVQFTWGNGEGADPKSPGISGNCPGCNIDAFAAGNIDNELKGIDSWHIATKDAAVPTLECGGDDKAIISGVPYNTKNDVDCD